LPAIRLKVKPKTGAHRCLTICLSDTVFAWWQWTKVQNKSWQR